VALPHTIVAVSSVGAVDASAVRAKGHVLLLSTRWMLWVRIGQYIQSHSVEARWIPSLVDNAVSSIIEICFAIRSPGDRSQVRKSE
jgi:hypothetical protein